MISGARASSCHQEARDEADDQRANDGRRHGHRQLLGRVVRPVDRCQARNQGKPSALVVVVAVKAGVAGYRRFEFSRILIVGLGFVSHVTVVL